MIVRLMGEGQYELEKKHMDEVNKIDNNIVKIRQKRRRVSISRANSRNFQIMSKRMGKRYLMT